MGPFDDLTLGNSSTNLGASTIVVQNGNARNVTNGACLPCNDETVCTIGQSNGSRLDLSKIRSSNNNVRFNVDTTTSEGAGSDQNMIFYTPLYPGSYASTFWSLEDYFGPNLLGGDDESDGSTINGIDARALMGQFNVASLNGGAVAAKVTIQYNSATYPQLDGITITSFRIPPNPNDSLDVEAIYSPLCDFCTTSGNGNFTTHAYNANLPVSGRQGFAIFVPGATGVGARFTVDLCFASNGFPNNEQTTWADAAE